MAGLACCLRRKRKARGKLPQPDKTKGAGGRNRKACLPREGTGRRLTRRRSQVDLESDVGSVGSDRDATPDMQMPDSPESTDLDAEAVRLPARRPRRPNARSPGPSAPRRRSARGSRYALRDRRG
jgi:hypothetical protein